MRLIDADALDFTIPENPHFMTATLVQVLKNAIDKVPTIEAEPVRHGRWKSVGLASLKCSVCGYVDDHKMYYKGCPECRAKMDKEG